MADVTSSNSISVGLGMMSDEGIEQAQTVLAELFACVGVKRVIEVDDRFAASLEKATAALLGEGADRRGELLGADPDLVSDEAVARQLLAERWDELEDEPSRLALAERITGPPEGEDAEDQRALSTLGELLSGIGTERLSLDGWQQRRDAVVEEVEAQPTLVLFDRDFSREAGGGEHTGEGLVSDFAQRARDVDAYCALLTRTVSRVDHHTEWRALAVSLGIPASRFVLVLKEDLLDHPLRFALTVGTSLLAPTLARLLQLTEKAVTDGQRKAAELAHELSSAELEDIVFRTSEDEGVWEGDTLLRLLAALERPRAGLGVRKDEAVRDMVTTIRCLRSAASAPADLGAAEAEAERPTGSAGWRHQRAEIYDEAEYVNSLHLPLELGDTFRKTNGQKSYVLVGQPCDLMMRGDGKRAPELTHAVLVPISISETTKRGIEFFELPLFDSNSGSYGYVQLNRPVLVSITSLELCALDSKGRARLDTGEGPSPLMLPTWTARHERLLKQIRKLLQAHEGLDDAEAEARLANQLGAFGDHLFKLTLEREPGIVSFNCKRGDRIRDPYATDLLNRYARHLMRTAYEHLLIAPPEGGAR